MKRALPAIGLVLAAMLLAPVAQAQAPTIVFRGLIERDVRSAFQVHDADRSGGNSAGDFVTGRLLLLKRGRRVAVATYRGTIVSINGSVANLHDDYVITFRRRGGVRGGHLYVGWDHTEDFNDAPNVGETQNIPIQRGDGRFAGYSGQLVSRVIRVARDGEPTYRDTIRLTKATP